MGQPQVDENHNFVLMSAARDHLPEYGRIWWVEEVHPDKWDRWALDRGHLLHIRLFDVEDCRCWEWENDQWAEIGLSAEK